MPHLLRWPWTCWPSWRTFPLSPRTRLPSSHAWWTERQMDKNRLRFCIVLCYSVALLHLEMLKIRITARINTTKTIFIWTCCDSLRTSGGSLRTSGGSLRTSDGSLRTSGGSLKDKRWLIKDMCWLIEDKWGLIRTRIGSLRTSGGSLRTSGGSSQFQSVMIHRK